MKLDINTFRQIKTLYKVIKFIQFKFNIQDIINCINLIKENNNQIINKNQELLLLENKLKTINCNCEDLDETCDNCYNTRNKLEGIYCYLHEPDNVYTILSAYIYKHKEFKNVYTSYI